jgi:hypothetical protein
MVLVAHPAPLARLGGHEADLGQQRQMPAVPVSSVATQRLLLYGNR